MLQFRILGPLEAFADGNPVALGGMLQRSALSMLLLNSGRVVPIDRFAAALYGTAPPATAVTQVQRQISELRRAFGTSDVVETVADGYLMRLAPGQLDLATFEQLAAEGESALRAGDPEKASESLSRALGLWRGEPLRDVAEGVAGPAVERLSELRVAVLEMAIEAELARGRHAQVVGELRTITAERPFHERFRRQLMLALYRSGRQAEALDEYRRARESIVRELGIEPAPQLRELQRRILAQDATLELVDTSRQENWPTTILVVACPGGGLDVALELAEPLARELGNELVLIELVEGESEVAGTTAALNARCARSPVPARGAAFVSHDLAVDLERLERSLDVRLTLIVSRGGFDVCATTAAPGLEGLRADVAVIGEPSAPAPGDGIFVPFGGSDDDWAALELAAWFGRATELPLALVGTGAHEATGRRDASRLLADASLVVQRLVGVAPSTVLVEAEPEALARTVAGAALVVIGAGGDGKKGTLGAARREILETPVRTVLLRRGDRPSAFAPREARTRFSWTLAP
jgi:DNA-binding SARP family transcriptional activator